MKRKEGHGFLFFAKIVSKKKKKKKIKKKKKKKKKIGENISK